MSISSGSLREGFSTGTAAAAAAKAAAAVLAGDPLPNQVSVALPPFALLNGCMRPETDGRLEIPIAAGGRLPDGTAFAEVIKDGGDDPDATHGARIGVRASLFPLGDEKTRGVAVKAFGNVFLYGGTGIGRVTLPGLPVRPGEPAINPQPRLQIAYAALEARKAPADCGEPPPESALHLEISVPDGEERARRTLNERLGIVGGVSVLGTRGTVRPYSHESWQAAICQGLDVAAALGISQLLLATGRRSERLGFGLYPHLPPQAGIQVADYAARAVREAVSRDFERLVWLCFPGKLLKLAQGLEWTHAEAGAADIALLARLCRQAGGAENLAEAVAAMPTAAGALDLMAAAPEGKMVRDSVLRRLAQMAYEVLKGWIKASRPGGRTPELCLHVFSLDEELLLSLP